MIEALLISGMTPAAILGLLVFLDRLEDGIRPSSSSRKGVAH